MIIVLFWVAKIQTIYIYTQIHRQAGLEWEWMSCQDVWRLGPRPSPSLPVVDRHILPRDGSIFHVFVHTLYGHVVECVIHAALMI